ILNLDKDADLRDVDAVKAQLEPLFEDYRAMYTEYYETCKHDNSPAIRDRNPVIILYPGVGMFAFAKDKQTARVAAEFYVNAINVMKGSEAISEYTALPRQEAFNIEYWLLEEAKLQRMPKPKALSGKIVLITGSAGGIGKAIAKKFIEEGAVVVINDLDEDRLSQTEQIFFKEFGADSFTSVALNVTKALDIENAFDIAALHFGGIDIVVNCAGLSISKTIEEHTDQDWDLLYDVLVKGQFKITQEAIKVFRKQRIGGDILNIGSKNALVSGPNNAGYGSAKAAQIHLSRLNAAELGKD